MTARRPGPPWQLAAGYTYMLHSCMRPTHQHSLALGPHLAPHLCSKRSPSLSLLLSFATAQLPLRAGCLNALPLTHAAHRYAQGVPLSLPLLDLRCSKEAGHHVGVYQVRVRWNRMGVGTAWVGSRATISARAHLSSLASGLYPPRRFSSSTSTHHQADEYTYSARASPARPNPQPPRSSPHCPTMASPHCPTVAQHSLWAWARQLGWQR